MPSRRGLLASVGLAGLGSFAGCLGGVGRPSVDDPPTPGTPPLDPTPGSGLSGGPAGRFERSFHGRAGPGPVLNDGTLYVVAVTSEESTHLLALA